MSASGARRELTANAISSSGEVLAREDNRPRQKSPDASQDLAAHDAATRPSEHPTPAHLFNCFTAFPGRIGGATERLLAHALCHHAS
jgi:hypothetical protein